jgi:hypothetical protein
VLDPLGGSDDECRAAMTGDQGGRILRVSRIDAGQLIAPKSLA